MSSFMQPGDAKLWSPMKPSKGVSKCIRISVKAAQWSGKQWDSESGNPNFIAKLLYDIA